MLWDAVKYYSLLNITILLLATLCLEEEGGYKEYEIQRTPRCVKTVLAMSLSEINQRIPIFRKVVTESPKVKRH